VLKIGADRLCYTYNETYDLGVDIIRCFNFFGPRQKDSGYGGVIAIFINRVLQGKPPIIYGDGNQTRDYNDKVLHSKDNPGKYGINFGTGSEKSVNDIAKLILNYANANKNLNPIHVDSRPTEVQRLFADITKAKGKLNFTPKINFEQGISTLIDWYKNYKSELWLY
jgi:UDP-glucose 4-epimerase